MDTTPFSFKQVFLSKAVCRPLCYQERILSRSLGSILVCYTLPVLLCSVVFNIPRLIRFSPLYNYLGEDPTFLQVRYVVDVMTMCL